MYISSSKKGKGDWGYGFSTGALGKKKQRQFFVVFLEKSRFTRGKLTTAAGSLDKQKVIIPDFKFNSWGLVYAKEIGYSRKIQTGWVEDILFWTSTLPPSTPSSPPPLWGWHNLNFLELKDCNSIVICEKIVRLVKETLFPYNKSLSYWFE